MIKLSCLTAFLIYCAGCTRSTPNDGNLHVRILNDDGSGNYVFQTVELKGVKNLNGMVSDTVVIRAGGYWDCQDKEACNNAAPPVIENHAPNAKFIRGDGYLIPADYRSLVMSTGMYHFQKVKELFDTFKGNEGLTFPSIINYDVHVFLKTEYGETGEFVNNAFYHIGMDNFFLIPFQDTNSVAISLNAGILAHEYSHRVFTNQVRRKIAALAPEYKTSLLRSHRCHVHKSTPTDQTDDRSDFVSALIGGFDEGIADYFAYVHTGNPNFMAPSFKRSEDTSGRDLSVDKVFDLSETEVEGELEKLKSYDSVEYTRLEPHEVGGVVANLFYTLSKELGHEATQRIIMKGLVKMSESMAQRLNKKDNTQFRQLVLGFLDGENLNQTTCEKIKSYFPHMIRKSDLKCNGSKVGEDI